MGIFGGSKSRSSSTTTNYTTTVSQTLGDLATGNFQSAGDQTIYGLAGEDLGGFLAAVQSMANAATTGNSNLAGKSIEQVAKGYQSAYSESTGIIQQLKPVLMIGAGLLAIILAPKILKGM